MKTIKYTEPKGYLPKEIRDKYFGKGAKKTSTVKTGTKTKTKK